MSNTYRPDEVVFIWNIFSQQERQPVTAELELVLTETIRCEHKRTYVC